MPPVLSFPPSPAIPLLLGALPALVLSEHKSRSLAGTSIFKMLSSVAFLSGPLLLTSTVSAPYPRLVTIGLAFSLVGDYCLLPSRREFYPTSATIDKTPAQPKKPSFSFHLGVLAFAAAHIAYVAAFLHDTPETSWLTFTATFVSTMGLAKWLGVIYPPATTSSGSGNVLDLLIPADMKPLVSIYAVIISAMFAAATSTAPLEFGTLWPYQRVLGAGMFVVSDVFVARDAFGRGEDAGRRGWGRILVGYGLYFWGQMVIAGTVHG